MVLHLYEFVFVLSLKYFFVIIFLVLVVFQKTDAQNVACRIIELDVDTTKNKLLPTEKTDTSSFRKKVNNNVQLLQNKGFINAYLKRMYFENETWNYEIEKGEKYQIAQVNIIDNNNETIVDIGFDDLEMKKQQILRKYENNGFPFVNIVSNIERIIEDKLYLKLIVNKGEYFKYDSIQLVQKVNIRPSFLANYLKIKPQKKYNEKNVREIDKRLRQLPYIEITKPSQIQFTDNVAKPILHLTNKKNSEFDFLIGLLPNNNTGKMQFSGNAKLHLNNPFGNGMAIKLNWQALQAGSQLLNLSYYYPYILHYPVAAKLGLAITKMDTTFLDIDRNIAFQSILNERNYIEVNYKLFSSNLLNVDTNAVKLSKKLPAQLDVKTSQYGLGFNFDNTDYRFNPRKGFRFYVMLAILSRTWKKNAIIENLKDNTGYNYAALYDTISPDKTQYRSHVQVENYLKLSRFLVLSNRVQSKAIFSDDIWKNESFRIGGLQSIRGFDDESIFCTKYVLINNELRFLIAKNSYFLLLNDIAWLEQKWASNPAASQQLISFGAGLTFETKVGIFQLNYALGKSNLSGFEFRRAKIHFGYVNLF